MEKIQDIENPYHNLWKDIFYILVSITVTILAVKLGLLSHILNSDSAGRAIDSFFAGIFFTSAFTLVPATFALAELSKTLPILSVAFFGACGAVLGDLILFIFIKDKFSEDLSLVLKKYHDKKLTRFFHRKFFKWLTPLIGAFIIVSPLPDEMGITMMGISKVRTETLVAISFVMNFIGVLLVAFVAGTL